MRPRPPLRPRPLAAAAVAALAAAALPPLPAAAEAGACPTMVSAATGLPTTGEWRTHPALADVDGDGHLDVAGHPRKRKGPRVWLGDGAGGFRESSQGLVLPRPGCGVGVDLADVDGDGDLDLGVADHCGGGFVFLGDGEGGWRLAGPLDPLDPRGIEDLAFGDLDGDGHTDVVAISTLRGGLGFYAGDASGRFRRRDVGLPDTGYGKDIELADLNGDGRLDVVASYSAGVDTPSSESDRRNAVWLSGPDGRWTAASDGIPLQMEGQFRGVSVGDVDGDGHPDLALSTTYHPARRPVAVYLGDGAGHWREAAEGLPPAAPTRAGAPEFADVALADLDGDGHLDLLGIRYDDAGLRLYRGDGGGRWTPCATGMEASRIPLRGWGLAVADVDEDGRPDVVAAYGKDGEGSIEVWLQR